MGKFALLANDAPPSVTKQLYVLEAAQNSQLEGLPIVCQGLCK